jgi:hypothetical protein
MDCLEFRRRLGADPRRDDADMRAHRAQCPACAGAWERAQQFERELDAALKVPVPEGLTERILLAQATGERRQRRRRRSRWLALAATVVLGVAGGGLVWRQLQARSLPVAAVAHVQAPEERFSLDLTRPISRQAVDKGFAGRGVALRGPMPADTTYVHDCQVGPYRAVHLVTRADGAPVVVLYVPGHHVHGERDFRRDGWQGREIATRDGTLVLLSNQPNTDTFTRLGVAWRDAIDGAATRLGGGIGKRIGRLAP